MPAQEESSFAFFFFSLLVMLEENLGKGRGKLRSMKSELLMRIEGCEMYSCVREQF